jgi:uncharacterized membrane protein
MKFKYSVTAFLLISCTGYLIKIKLSDSGQADVKAAAEIAANSGQDVQSAQIGHAKQPFAEMKKTAEQSAREIQSQLSAAQLKIKSLSEELRIARVNSQSLEVSLAKINSIVRDFNDFSIETAVPSRAPKDELRPVLTNAAGSNALAPAVKKQRGNSNSDIESSIEELNADPADLIVSATESSDHQLTINLNGAAMLLTDRNHPRVSSKLLTRLRPLVSQLSSRQLKSVEVYVQEGVPPSHVKVLMNFLRKQYGWDAKIETARGLASESAGASKATAPLIFPLQIQVTPR